MFTLAGNRAVSSRLKAGVAALMLGCAAQASAPRTEITIGGQNAFPENITSTRDGTIIASSVGSGGVFKAGPHASAATQWIAPGDHGLLDTFGVLADEASETLWVCSSRMDPPVAGQPAGVPALYRYNLRTGKFRSKHAFPGGVGLCNDIAIGPDQAAYVADTVGGRVLRLRLGSETLEVWSQVAELDGADGLAFSARQLFVNSFTSGRLLRFDLKSDGSASDPVTLTTSRVLDRPDGMRRLNSTQFVLAEGSGTIDLLTVEGDRVDVQTLRAGLSGPAGVTIIGNTVWALESKLSMRGKQNVRPAPFKAFALPSPPDNPAR